MRPLILKGHERPLTMIKFNREGDLLFSCAKDHVPTVWYSENGERLGTYEGHTGAVWSCDISYNTEYMLTASADCTVKLWNIQNGKEIFSFPHPGPVRSVNFSTGDKMFVSVTDPFREKPSAITVYNLNKNNIHQQTHLSKLSILNHGHEGRVTGVYWMPLNKGIMSTGSDGYIKIFNSEDGKLISEHKIHNADILCVSFNKEKTLFITSSKDNTAKLIDTKTMNILKLYETDRPVNSAAISPLKEHVVLGGGQEAMSVTTTSGRVGKFEARFFHLIYEKEFGRVKGHFGPINTIAFHPDGKAYASGAEDGYIRLHYFDKDYLESDNNGLDNSDPQPED